MLDYDSEVPQVEREGHKRISLRGYTEAPMTIGRYATLLASGEFGGYVNVGAFNASDGDSVTTVQLRQLETVAVQSRRRREGVYERPSA